MIHFQGITKRYVTHDAAEASAPALNGVSLLVPRGQFCVVLGPSGSGKSTLLRTVNGLVIPDQGNTTLNDTRVDRTTIAAIRRRVGMIHQSFNLVPRLSVLDNVVSGALPDLPAWRVMLRWWPGELNRTACEWLARVDLKPNYLARRVSQLSGGEQQRVAIARAFVNAPTVVLADEPVASLDPQTSRIVLRILRNAARQTGVTVLCSLHQVDLAVEFADRIVALRNGHVVFDDTPEKLDSEAIRSIYEGRP